MVERQSRIALLIDADNARAADIDAILNELSTLGETNVRRAYGDWDHTNLTGWKEVLHARAIRPMQQYAYSKGKNASDMALVVDAMALLYSDQPDAFGIVSSDADFTPLIMHLRERGVAVYGFGERKTPKPFVSACSRFLFLDQLAPEEDSGDGPGGRPLRRTAQELQGDAGLVRLLRNAVSAAAAESGWAKVQAVRAQIGNQSSFDPRNHGYATMTKLLAATELFDLRDESTPAVSVRDKRLPPPAVKKSPKKILAKKAPVKKNPAPNA